MTGSEIEKQLAKELGFCIEIDIAGDKADETSYPEINYANGTFKPATEEECQLWQALVERDKKFEEYIEKTRTIAKPMAEYVKELEQQLLDAKAKFERAKESRRGD